MSEKKYTAKQIVEAVKGTGGILTHIAKKLSVTRMTINNYKNRYKTVAKAIEEERQKIIDKAERNIFDAINSGDTHISKWALRTIGKDRGYVEKEEREISGQFKTDNEIKIEVIHTTPEDEEE